MDVFISYAGSDRAWAEWVAWQLDAAGYSVELDVWDWSTGENFILRMSDALTRAHRIIALWSVAYFDRSRFTMDEWTTALRADRLSGANVPRLIPLRIEEVAPPSVLAPIVFRDLFGISAEQARQVLLSAVTGRSVRPSMTPVFPGGPTNAPSSEPRLPGTLPEVCNLPTRLAGFTGRDELLARLRQSLSTGGIVAVQALHGLGGVGKTTLAIEYAHRFAGSYELIWWVDAERHELIGDQLADLAVSAGWSEPETDIATSIDRVRRRLRGTSDWLVVFDNVESPRVLLPWLPTGPGHVLVTSRSPSWSRLALPVQVDVFDRAESIALLRQHVPAMSTGEADGLAGELGDLPLAMAQAAGVIAETGMPTAEYQAELARHPAAVLTEGVDERHEQSLAAVVAVATEQLAGLDNAAVQMVELCAFLAPEPVPVELFTAAAPEVLAGPIALVANSPFALRQAMARVARFGLARTGPEGMLVHRLTQAIIRDRLEVSGQLAETVVRARALVVTATPASGSHPAGWPRWSRLLPHLLALDPATSDDRDLLAAVYRAAWYLLLRGELSTASAIAVSLHHRTAEVFGADDALTLDAAYTVAAALQRRGELAQALKLFTDVYTYRQRVSGPDHPRTLDTATWLAGTLSLLGRFKEARMLSEDTLARYRRVLGEDHQHTLFAARIFASSLQGAGDLERAAVLHEDTLGRRRRLLGEDHPETLSSARSLAANLRGLGQFEQARKLDEDTLARCRRVLGDEHPDTLRSADGLAADLRGLGQFEQARKLDEDTLARCRRVLGDEHPDTLRSADGLAADLRGLPAETDE